MSKPRGNGFPFAKIVVVFALPLIVGFGLCGLDLYLGSKGIGKGTEELAVGPIDGLSLIVMLLSAVGLVIMLIAWALSAIIRGLGFGRDSSEPQKLFDDKDGGDLKK